MKNIKLIGLLSVVIIIVAIGAYAMGQNNIDDSSVLFGELEILETKYDFGTIGLDHASHSFMVKNIGAGPLTIDKVSTSCGCTSARLIKDGKASTKFGMDHGNLPKANMTLEVGEEVEVVVTYDPLAHGPKNAAGYFNRIVYIKTSNPKEEYELMVTMTVDPDLNI